jgi:hypothetical protein
MKIFWIIFICFCFINNISTAQNEKIINNIGIYLSPKIQTSLIFDKERKITCGGYIFELGTRPNIIDKKLHVHIGVGYGSLNYDYYLDDMIFANDKPFDNLTANRFDFNLELGYNLLKKENNGLLNIHVGLKTIFHFDEKIYDNDILILGLNNFRFVNLNLPIGLSYEQLVSENLSISIGVNSFFWINLFTSQRDYVGVINTDYLFNNGYRDIGLKFGVSYKW